MSRAPRTPAIEVRPLAVSCSIVPNQKSAIRTPSVAKGNSEVGLQRVLVPTGHKNGHFVGEESTVATVPSAAIVLTTARLLPSGDVSTAVTQTVPSGPTAIRRADFAATRRS